MILEVVKVLPCYWYHGEAVVQWLAFGHANYGPRFEFQYPLATFLSLVLPPSSQRLPELLSYCPQTGLTKLYAFEALAAIASLSFLTTSKENVKYRGVTIKNLNLRQ